MVEWPSKAIGFSNYKLSWCCSHWLLKSSLCSFDQLVVGQTNEHCGTLHLLMINVSNLVQVAVVAHIGNSDHSSLSAVILMVLTIPNLSVSREIFLKHKVNWTTVCGAIHDLPWYNIWSPDNYVEDSNEHLSLLVIHCVSTKVKRVHNKDKPGFDALASSRGSCSMDL